MDFRTFLQHLGGRLFSNNERRKLHGYYKDIDSQCGPALPATYDYPGRFQIDVVIFQTQLFYYESIWLVLFFLVIQLAITGLLSVRLYKKYYQK